MGKQSRYLDENRVKLAGDPQGKRKTVVRRRAARYSADTFVNSAHKNAPHQKKNELRVNENPTLQPLRVTENPNNQTFLQRIKASREPQEWSSRSVGTYSQKD